LGNVKDLLEKNRSNWGEYLDPLDLILMAKDAAAGMLYLSSNTVIHRDLAARNLLVGYRSVPRKKKNQDGKEEVSLLGGYMVKVADFGISRKLEDKAYYVAKNSSQIPIKWTAPEAIKKGRKYIYASDIWSFGVVLYELFEFGKEPYHEMENKEVKRQIMKDAPMWQFLSLKDAPDGIDNLLKDCLNNDPEKRPTFKECFDRLSKIAEELDGNQIASDKWKENMRGKFTNGNSSKPNEEGYYKDHYNEEEKGEADYEGAYVVPLLFICSKIIWELSRNRKNE